MADPTLVNGQITDAVTQTNVKVLAEAPAMALGNVYQALSHSSGILFENATEGQKRMSLLGEAVTAAACAMFTQKSGS